MRFIFTIAITLALATGRSQTLDTIDTVRRGDVDYLYVNNRLIERIHYAADKIDIRVIYVYRNGVLVRREWWQRGKMISTTIE